MRPHTVLLLIYLAILVPGPDTAAKPLRLPDHIAADPVMVFVTGGGDLGAVWEGWLGLADRIGPEGATAEARQSLVDLDRELGCSIRGDVLDLIGPEYALVIDLPALDRAAGAMGAGGPAALGELLTNIGVLARVREPERLGSCLRALLTHGETTVVDTEDGLHRFEIDGLPIFYGLSGGVLALGPSTDFVVGSLEQRPSGQRLAEDVYPGPTDGFEPVAVIHDSLSPVYMRRLPETDGWGHRFLVWSDGENYRLVSPGKDGQLDRDWTGPLDDVAGATTLFTADIVYVNGSFVAWPEGKQQ